MSDDREKEQLSLGLEITDKKQSDLKTTEAETEYDGPVLEWVCHPAKKNRLITVAVTVFIAIVIIVVYMLTYSVFFTILGFVIMTASLAAFYFPTGYKMTENEIIVKTTMQKLHKKWSQYRSCYPDKNGVLLSPFVRPSRLENFRGTYIRFWYNKEEVVSFVKKMIEKNREVEK
jgi:hypothetical protein